MNVITQERLITDLSWWSQMMVEGDSIVLSDVRTARGKGEEPPPEPLPKPNTLVIASLPDKEKVQELFKDLNASIRHGKEAFDVSIWLDERSA